MKRVLLPVRWGTRTYLVPPEDMSVFCDEMAQGFEPRLASKGRFFLDDTTSRVAGAPRLPPQWASYLDRRLRLGKVVAIVDESQVRVDFGADRGIRVGDRLAVQFWDRFAPRLIVRQVDGDSCIARLEARNDGEAHLMSAVRSRRLETSDRLGQHGRPVTIRVVTKPSQDDAIRPFGTSGMARMSAVVDGAGTPVTARTPQRAAGSRWGRAGSDPTD